MTTKTDQSTDADVNSKDGIEGRYIMKDGIKIIDCIEQTASNTRHWSINGSINGSIDARLEGSKVGI